VPIEEEEEELCVMIVNVVGQLGLSKQVKKWSLTSIKFQYATVNSCHSIFIYLSCWKKHHGGGSFVFICKVLTDDSYSKP
jgi:hypothetical protein